MADVEALTLEEVAFRFEGHGWVAYNIGPPTPWCAKSWSTALGTDDVEDLFTLFRHSNLTFLPPGPGGGRTAS